MTGSPRKGLHTYVNVVAASLNHLQNAGHVEARTCMAVVLHRDVLDLLDACYNLAKRNRASDTGHILDTDFVGASLDKLLGHIDVVFYGMHGRGGDAE